MIAVSLPCRRIAFTPGLSNDQKLNLIYNIWCYRFKWKYPLPSEIRLADVVYF